MEIGGSLLTAGLAALILGWVIFRSMMRRSQRNRQASPLRQLADAKAELDKRESRGDRALRDAPPEVLRWQVEIAEIARDIHGQVDTKIALLAATIRLADQRLAELKQMVETAERLLESEPAESANFDSIDSTEAPQTFDSTGS